MENSIGAFWQKVGKEGSEYFTGDVEGKRYVMFFNKYANKENKQPYFKVYVAREQKPKETSDIPF